MVGIRLGLLRNIEMPSCSWVVKELVSKQWICAEGGD